MARIVYTDLSGSEQTVPFGPDHPVVTVGRATDCTIRSNRKSVSRRHAEFRYSNGQFEVIDLNSSNGTYLMINEERKPIIGREYLADNDEVWCGDFIIRFFEEGGVSQPVTSGQSPASGNGGQQQGKWGQQGSRDNAAYATEPPDGVAFGGSQPVQAGGGVGFGGSQAPSSEHVFGDSIAEESSAAWHHEDDPPTRNAGIDVGRLMAEKESIEDLAARQATEIEVLQTRLEEALNDDDTGRVQDNEELSQMRDELEESRAEQSRLEARLHDAMQTAAQTSNLSSELDELKRKNQQLDAEWRAANQRVEELTTRLDTSAAERDELDRLREENRAKARDVTALEEEIERLHGSIGELRDKASQADEGDRAREEVEAVRKELERHTRLVEEFERRNRDLQKELEELKESAEEVEESEEALARRVGELEDELRVVREARDQALEAASKEGSEEDLANLKNEVEGLKRRLKMEKERAAEAEAEAGEKIAELETMVQEAAEAADSMDHGDIDPVRMREGAELVAQLSRVVDAIERADLDALSTVDRVRLQSALRDTEPRATLEDLETIFSSNESSS